MLKVACDRCQGKKEIRAFSHVLGGTCFKCHGAGFVMQKNPPRKSLRWQVSAIDRETGERVNVCRFAERSERAALQRAVNQLSGGKGYHAETAQVTRIEN